MTRSKHLRATALAAVMALSLLAMSVAVAPVGAQQLDNRTDDTTIAPGQSVEITVEVSSDQSNILGLNEEITAGSQYAEITSASSGAGEAQIKDGNTVVEVAYLDDNDFPAPVSSDTLTYTVTVSDDAPEETVELGGNIVASTESNDASTGTTTLNIQQASPGPFTVANLDPAQAEAAPGDQLTVSADVTNEGMANGDTEVNLTLDGTVEDTQTVNLDAGETQGVDFTITAPSNIGEYTHGIETSDDSETGTLTLAEPPVFNLTSLSDTRVIAQGETSTLQPTIQNDGGAGEQTVSLQVSGTTVDSSTLSLEAGASSDVSLAISTADRQPGEYTYTVSTDDDSASGTLTVEASVTTYERDGEVSIRSVRDAVGDWQAGDIDLQLLRDVISEWRQN